MMFQMSSGEKKSASSHHINGCIESGAMSMCLGTRVITLTRNQPSINISGDNRATILVEIKNGDRIEIRLCTGMNTYCYSVTFSDISSIFNGTYENSDDDDTPAVITARMIEFGHHFLQEDPDSSSEGRNKDKTTKFDNIRISFEYNVIEGVDDDCNLIIREKLQHNMMRIILRSKMKKVVDRLSYCITIGKALSQSIEEVKKRKSQVSMWKKTTEDLDRTQQESKDTLLANFTNLRNFLIGKHKEQLKELKESHEEEKKSWKKKTPATVSVPRRVLPKPRNLLDEEFPGNEIDCLAEGRKITTTTTNKEAIIKDPFDMVNLQREEQAYNNKRKKVQQQSIPSSHDDDDSTVSGGSGWTLHREEQNMKKQKKKKSSTIEIPSTQAKSKTTATAPELKDDASTSSELSWTLGR